MELCLLGPVEVRVGGHVLPLRAGRPRKLLVALALRLGERVPTETLIEVVWGPGADQDRLNALQVLVSYLRKVLSATAGAATIETVEGGYRLVADRDDVDVHRLQAAVAEVPHLADPDDRLRRLDGALGAWRGPPIPELAEDPFAQADLHRLGELRVAALELRIDALLALGRHLEAAADLQHLVVLHPLRERFHAQLMTALYRSGRQAEALAAYDRARTVLVEELGLDPGPELQSLAQAVLTQSPHLRAPAPREPPADPGGEGPGARVHRPTREALPVLLEPLIGREREVSRLTQLMTEHRLITLIGPGGAGKTRLAAHLAAHAGGPVWWVDLSSLRGDDRAAAAVAGAAALRLGPDDDEAVLVSQLAGQAGLLVLDTCERVRAGLRPLVEALLRSCPAVRVLATSRTPLGAASELAWPVPPLSLPDPDSRSPGEIAASAAVQLFVERAAHRRPDFALTAGNCAEVARICLVLDGLPLAIELAAAHAGVLEPSDMVRVLDDRLRMLVDDTRDDRQHTLRSTIAWSYELLSQDEAVFFDRLSVFAGSFPLDAAVAVAGEGLGRDGLQLLLALAQQSLVAAVGGGRFRLLDTVRAFAAERLGQRGREETATHRRHAAWYADLLSATGAPQRRSRVEGWKGELRDVLADVRAALGWCFASGEEELGARLLAAMWWLWPREGVFDEAAQWFPRAAALVPRGSALQADLLASAGTYAASRGELGSAIRDCSAAAELYDLLGYRRSLAQALIGLGIAQWGRGDHRAAARTHDRAAQLFAELADAWGLALCLVLRARTAVDAHEADAADRLARAEAAARRCGDAHVVASALAQRARAEVATGRWGAARRTAEESLRLNETHGHREGAVGSLHVLGLALVGEGELSRATSVLGRALRAAVALRHAGATAEGLDCLAVLASRQERWLDAAVTLGAAEALRSRTGIRRSALTGRLVGEVEHVLSRRLGADALTRATEQGGAVDVLELAPDAPPARTGGPLPDEQPLVGSLPGGAAVSPPTAG